MIVEYLCEHSPEMARYKKYVNSINNILADEDYGTYCFDQLVARLQPLQTHVERMLDAVRSARLVTGRIAVDASAKPLTPTFVQTNGPIVLDAAHGTPLPLVPEKALTHCPTHMFTLFKGIDTVHHKCREDPDYEGAYACAHRPNPVFRELCCSEAEQKLPCVADDFYVCPIDTCNFSICANCMRLNFIGKVKATAAQRKYILQRAGLLSVVGLLTIFFAQAMYQPAVKSAITTIFCHASLLCSFPDCYNPATGAFLWLVIASCIVLVVVGIGLVWFLFATVFDRKRAILDASILHGHLTYGGEPFEEDYATWLHVLRVSCPEEPGREPWKAVLLKDKTMFKGLYEQYEFKWMLIHPITFFFKVGTVVIVLYAGEPNSLRVIVAASVVEVAQLLFYMVSSPFTDYWLDLLTKAGSLHQVAQLGLLCLYRADTYIDPSNKAAAIAMIALAAIYIIILCIVIAVVVVMPFWAARKARKALLEERLRAHEAELEAKRARRRSSTHRAHRPRGVGGSTAAAHRRASYRQPSDGAQRNNNDDDDAERENHPQFVASADEFEASTEQDQATPHGTRQDAGGADNDRV